MALDRKEVFVASKILLDFMRDFSNLTEQQLLSVRKMMEGIVQDVMDSMSRISDEAAQSKAKASSILVRDKNAGGFVHSKSESVEKLEDQHLEGGSNETRVEILENRLLRGSGVFSKHLETLSKLDGELQGLISRAVGAVSSDDIIAQRLGHIVGSIRTLHAALIKLLHDAKTRGDPQAIKAVRNRVLTEIYLSYSGEDEREIFHRIFGHPRDKKKAS